MIPAATPCVAPPGIAAVGRGANIANIAKGGWQGGWQMNVSAPPVIEGEVVELAERRPAIERDD